MNKQKKTVSLRDIANRTGLSITTVSKVLNNTSGSAVSEDKRNIILKVAGELNYRPNRVAKYFESGKTGQIAYIIPHMFFTNYSARASFSLIMEIYAGAVEYFAQHNYMANLLFSPPENGQDFLRANLLAQRSVDGAIIFCGDQELSMVDEFKAMSIPVVTYDWRGTDYQISSVEESPFSGVTQAVKRLKELGHSAAGCLYFYDEAKAHQAIKRTDVIINVCMEHGIKIVPEYTDTYIDETDAYLKTKKMFSNGGTPPTVIFYPSDHSAMMGIRALLDLGIKVPEEVSVIGFDNAPFNVNSAVPLATIGVPRRLQGANGAKLLLEKINHPEEDEVKTISVHTEYISNSSVSPALEKSSVTPNT